MPSRKARRSRRFAALYGVLLVIRWYWARTRPAWFYPLFALAITESVQLVGVYPVFASLILPARWRPMT